MIQQLLIAVVISAGVAAAASLLTLQVARRSVRWAVVLTPLTVVLAIAAGVLVGVRLMLIGDASVLLWILATTAPVALAAGAFVATRTQRLITRAGEELAAERRRREVAEGRRQLIAGMSHDLRTPLAGIRAMTEALEDGVAPDPPAYHRQIIGEVDRTTAMIDDVLALGRLQSGATVLSAEPVEVGDLASDLIGQLQPFAAACGVRLSGSVRGERGTELAADPGMLSRAVQNLVVNAIQYSGPGGRVDVSVTGWPEGVRVVVTDTCGGLSPEDRERMFEAGWRGDAARTPGTAAGTGLGLAIVQTIVEAHGGNVAPHDSPGGCAMVLDLPRRR